MNALRDNLHPEQDLAGVTESVLAEVEAWPWEKVFPPGTRVRPVGGGEVYTVGFLSSETDLYVEHPVEGGLLGRPWAFVPVEEQDRTPQDDSQNADAKGREDVAVPPSPRSCSVCQRLRSRGSFEPAHGIFICVQCERDAKQFLEIQESIWGAGGKDEQGSGPAGEA